MGAAVAPSSTVLIRKRAVTGHVVIESHVDVRAAAVDPRSQQGHGAAGLEGLTGDRDGRLCERATSLSMVWRRPHPDPIVSLLRSHSRLQLFEPGSKITAAHAGVPS